MWTLKRSGIMTEIYQSSPSYTAGHLTLAISNKPKKISKADRLGHDSQLQLQTLPTTLEGKRTEKYLSDVVAPRPCQTHTGHWNTKILPRWSATLADHSTIFFFFWTTTPIKSNKTGKEKEQWRHSTKMAQLPQVHILPKGLKRVPPRLVNQSLVRGWLSCTQGNVMSSTISH